MTTGGSEDRTSAWAAYYAQLKDRPPRQTTVFAARRFAQPGLLVDLGAGGGRDCLPLIADGWRAIAIDREPSAITAIRANLPPGGEDRLETRLAAFEDADWPPVDLAISCFALPLAPKPAFPRLWRRIVERLRPGGRFAGQLYGRRDSWARDGAPDGVVAFDRAGCISLFDGMRIEFFEEEEHNGVTPKGRHKHWHIFHVVAHRS